MENLKDMSDGEDNSDSNTNVINQDRPPELPPRPLNLLSLSPRHPPPHAPAYHAPPPQDPSPGEELRVLKSHLDALLVAPTREL